MKTVYLASPYSHDDPAVRLHRYEAVTQAAADIIADSGGRIMVFAPITHSHPLFVLRPETGADYKHWQAFDELMIRTCDELWILTISGWRESAGVQAEIAYAKHIWQPVKYMDPLTGVKFNEPPYFG